MASLAVGAPRPRTQTSLASPASAPRLTHAHYSSLSPTSSDVKHMALSPGRDSAGVGMWTDEEHARFLEAVKLFANGPWKRVADYVGTRSVRQTMTHAQKYRLKAARKLRNLRAKSDLLLRHSLGSPVSLPMHPRLLPFTVKQEAERPAKTRKRSNSSTTTNSGKTSKRRHYASLDTVSITDAVSILDAKLLLSPAPVAAVDVKAATPTEVEEAVRPVDVVKEEAPSEVETEEETELELKLDEDMDMELASAIEAILDSDLEACPSLEACASELLDLLF